ncbi:MAG: hypothetical protein EKK57_05705 [Proteobacteria bacterium]|nr:MAG: hypothetical protein EKK57_05705 [Pseudomonadota bacterium]
MNATIHAELSAKRNKTKSDKDFQWFYKLHDFFDSSKEVDSTNRHRILTHQLWFTKQVIIPIFGETYTTENGRVINIKDLSESDHLAADFKGRFIPSLGDYVSLINDSKEIQDSITKFFLDNQKTIESDSKLKELLSSPVSLTGERKSLLVTCNSWFIGFILPKLGFNVNFVSTINPSVLFNNMNFVDWINNGANNDLPPSWKNLSNKNKAGKDQIIDGSSTFIENARLKDEINQLKETISKLEKENAKLSKKDNTIDISEIEEYFKKKKPQIIPKAPFDPFDNPYRPPWPNRPEITD